MLVPSVSLDVRIDLIPAMDAVVFGCDKSRKRIITYSISAVFILKGTVVLTICPCAVDLVSHRETIFEPVDGHRTDLLP